MESKQLGELLRNLIKLAPGTKEGELDKLSPRQLQEAYDKLKHRRDIMEIKIYMYYRMVTYKTETGHCWSAVFVKPDPEDEASQKLIRLKRQARPHKN